jgi:hypothetical protein
LTETENGVPHGTNTLTGADPGKLKTHLHWPVGGVTTEELETTDDEVALETELIGVTAEEVAIEEVCAVDEFWLEELNAAELVANELEEVGTTVDETVEDWLELVGTTTLETANEELDTALLEGAIVDELTIEDELDAGTTEEAALDELAIVDDEVIELTGITDEICETTGLEVAAELELFPILELAITADETGEVVTEEVEAWTLDWLADEVGVEFIELIIDDVLGTEDIEVTELNEVAGSDETIELVGTVEEIIEEELAGTELEEETLEETTSEETCDDEAKEEESLTKLDNMDTLDFVELELDGTAELLIIPLETVEDPELIVELTLDEEELVGVALNNTSRGLLHGTLNSKFIKKKLYLTTHVRSSPFGNWDWALAIGVFAKLASESETNIAAIITNENSFLDIKVCINNFGFRV